MAFILSRRQRVKTILIQKLQFSGCRINTTDIIFSWNWSFAECNHLIRSALNRDLVGWPLWYTKAFWNSVVTQISCNFYHVQCFLPICPIVLKFCTEHGSDTAVLCIKFQDDCATERDVIDEQDFARFQLKKTRTSGFVATPRHTIMPMGIEVPDPFHIKVDLLRLLQSGDFSENKNNYFVS